MDQEKIGKFIAQCRKELNMTQEQLAEKLGISNKTVSRWENGNTFPDISILQDLCGALNISVNELLAGERIPEDNFKKRVEENTLRILESCNPANFDYDKPVEEINFNICGIIAIVFLILKLTNVIDWSWIWVLAPLWIGFILCAITTVAVLIVVKRKIFKKHKIPRIKIKFLDL